MRLDNQCGTGSPIKIPAKELRTVRSGNGQGTASEGVALEIKIYHSVKQPVDQKIRHRHITASTTLGNKVL